MTLFNHVKISIKILLNIFKIQKKLIKNLNFTHFIFNFKYKFNIKNYFFKKKIF